MIETNEPLDPLASRRDFLATGIAGASLLLGSSCGGASPIVEASSGSARHTVPAVFPDTFEGRICATAVGLRGTGDLGRTYLRSYLGRKEGDVGARIAALVAELRSRSSRADSPVEEQLAELVIEDFENDRIVFVGGWYLSQTECRLAALAVLLRGEEQESADKTSLRAPDPLARASSGKVADVGRWGPKRVAVGAPEDLREHGQFRMWLAIEQPPQALCVYVGGEATATTIGKDIVTLALGQDAFERLLLAPGVLAIELYDVSRGIKQHVGDLVVE